MNTLKETFMQFMTHEDFLECQKHNPAYYHDGRWAYYSEAISLIKTNFADSKHVLELGCFEHSIVSNGDTMDATNKFKPTYHMDATKTPWKQIADKQYDLFIGLQVFEHLGDSQAEVFKEVQRTCKYAVLSFPWMWKNIKDLKHYKINEVHVNKWTCNMKPLSVTIVGIRRIYIYKF